MTTTVTFANGTVVSFPDDFDGPQYLVALPLLAEAMVSEADRVVAAAATAGLATVSTSSVAIGTGTKNFTVETGKAFVSGVGVKIIDSANSANYMVGTVTSYDTGTGALVVSVSYVGGSGTIASWNIIPWQDVVSGPTSATDLGLVMMNGTTGRMVQGSSYWTLTTGGTLVGGGKPAYRIAMKGDSDSSVSSGSHALNFNNGNYGGEITATGDFTLTTSNFPSSNPGAMLFKATDWGAHTVTLGAGLEFEDGVSPDFTVSGTDLCIYFQDAAGTGFLKIIAYDIATV